MSWVAVAVGGSAVVGAVAANSAANKQVDASNRAAGLSGQQYEQTRADLMPWQKAGGVALGDLQNRLPELTAPFDMSKFQESPAYQFNLQQGQQAIEKAAAKRGTYYAPATLQDIGKYSQGVASNEFQNAFSNYNTNMGNIWNRLYGLSNTGLNAAGQSGAFGANAAAQQGGYITGGANAEAAGIVGGANAINQGVGQYFNNQLMTQFLENQQRSNYGRPRDTAYYGGSI